MCKYDHGARFHDYCTLLITVVYSLTSGNMSVNLFACMFWLDENQYSVVPATDIVEGSTVKEGTEAVVAWRVCKKNKVHTSWYKAKIIKYSGK